MKTYIVGIYHEEYKVLADSEQEAKEKYAKKLSGICPCPINCIPSSYLKVFRKPSSQAQYLDLLN